MNRNRKGSKGEQRTCRMSRDMVTIPCRVLGFVRLDPREAEGANPRHTSPVHLGEQVWPSGLNCLIHHHDLELPYEHTMSLPFGAMTCSRRRQDQPRRQLSETYTISVRTKSNLTGGSQKRAFLKMRSRQRGS